MNSDRTLHTVSSLQNSVEVVKVFEKFSGKSVEVLRFEESVIKQVF
jgi:hypothetical protein